MSQRSQALPCVAMVTRAALERSSGCVKLFIVSVSAVCEIHENP